METKLNISFNQKLGLWEYADTKTLAQSEDGMLYSNRTTRYYTKDKPDSVATVKAGTVLLSVEEYDVNLTNTNEDYSSEPHPRYFAIDNKAAKAAQQALGLAYVPTTIITSSLRSIYGKIFGEDYDKDLLANPNIEKAFSIMLSAKQTGITPVEFFEEVMLNDKPQNKAIRLNYQNSLIRFSGDKTVNNKKLPFDINISLSDKQIDITNKCHVPYKDSIIVCDIPESYTKNTLAKNEVSMFVLPSSEQGKTAFEKILYSTAMGSCVNALDGKLSEEEVLKQLAEGKIIDTDSAHIAYKAKEGALEISSEKDNINTSKLYTLQTIMHGGAEVEAVGYSKKESGLVKPPQTPRPSM